MQDTTWRDKDWIGRGLSYSANAGKEIVLKQKNLLLHIPSNFAHLCPIPGLSVQALLRVMERVTEGKAMPMLRGEDLISAEEPNTGLEKLFEALVIPPPAIMEQMYAAFGQAWFDGRARSIVDFTDLKRETRYPLPTLEVYREFARANTTRREWARAEEWMRRGKHDARLAAAIQLAQKLMFAFEWDAEVRALHATVPAVDLIRMLDASWLNDSQVDMLMQVLTDRKRRENGDSDVIFAPVVFQQFVQELYDHRGCENYRKIPFMERYEEDLVSGRKRVLYLVGHVNGNHWVPWIFDNEKGILGHGEETSHYLSVDSKSDKKRDLAYQGTPCISGRT